MNPIISRRHFIGTAAAVPFGVAGALALAGPVNLPAAGPAVRPRPALLKTGLNVYSFLELLNAHAKDPGQGVDLFKVCDFCAEHGFDGVDVTGYFFPGYPGVPDDGYLIRLKRHVFNLGLCFSGTGVRNDFTAADPRVRAEGVQRIKQIRSRAGWPGRCTNAPSTGQGTA